MKRGTTLFFYILGGYVLLQFAWWGYHLIELTQINRIEDQNVNRKVLMILSEGLVFFFIILLGLWRIRYSIKRELFLIERQQNFLLSVTHELKTPLASNKLFLQTLLKRKLDPEKQADLLEKAISENVRLEGMIDNILNATRLDHQNVQIQKENFALNDLVKKIVQRYEKTYQVSNLQLQHSENISVHADQQLVETAIVNLLDNALKYAGSEAPIVVRFSENQKRVTLHVEDEGPGIPKEYEKEIFHKFSRIGNEETRQKKGSGLGLYIAREFVRLNDGDLFVSPSSKGAHFILTLKKA